jgi:hypothetical protein
VPHDQDAHGANVTPIPRRGDTRGWTAGVRRGNVG